LRRGSYEWEDINISLNELPYGGSCTYVIRSGCGFPKLEVNNTNIDMIVSFKRSEWGNDSFIPTDDVTYDDDEVVNVKPS
jgi:hypothetical protein